jgi:hypothetical protein
MISCILSPLELAFPDLNAYDSMYKALLNLIDVLFAFQIIVSFFLAFEEESMVIVDDMKKIAIRYIKGWFAIDFISIFPIDIILEYALV